MNYFKTFAEAFQNNVSEIWNIIEKMLLGGFVILISKESYKTVEVIEVLKALIYPYEYHGFILPYDEQPNQALIQSRLSYLIGCGK